MLIKIDTLHLLKGTNAFQINYDKQNKLYIKRNDDMKLYEEGKDFKVQNNGSIKLIIFNNPISKESDYVIFFYMEDRD